MPFEIREIMFLLPEFQKVLLTSSNHPDLPAGLENADARLVDVMHTDDMAMALADSGGPYPYEAGQTRRQALQKALDVYSGPPGKAILVILRNGEHAQSPHGRSGVLLDEELVLDVLVEACSKEKIMLPRCARKEVVTRDKMIGLRIHMRDAAFYRRQGTMAAS